MVHCSLEKHSPYLRVKDFSLSSFLRTAVTKYHRWGLNNSRILFLTVLQLRKSKIKALTISVPGEGLLSGSQTAVFSVCSHVEEGARELSGVCFIRK